MVKKLLGRFNVETFVLKTKYQSEKSELEKKIPDTIERKIPTISGLADKSAVKSKKKKKKRKKRKAYNAKINEIRKKIIDQNHDKYITTLEFNEFTAEIFATRSALTNFDTKLIQSMIQSIILIQSMYLLKMN